MAALLDQSLLWQEDVDGEPRLVMLETIREYSLERLEQSGEAETIRRRHAQYLLTLAERAELELLGPAQGVWLQRLEAERANLLATLTWAFNQREMETALRLCTALWRFWDARGPVSEGRRWLEAILGQAKTVPAALRAKALCGAGYLAANSDASAARTYFEESLTISQILGDKPIIALALLGLGNTAVDEEHAIAFYEESLAIYRELASKSGIAWTLTGLGERAFARGNYAQSATRYAESLTLYRALGDKGGIAWTLYALAEIALNQADSAQAAELFRESLAVAQDIGSKALIAWALSGLGTVALSEGDDDRAAIYYERALVLYREYGHKWNIARLVTYLGNLAIGQSDLEQAALFLTEGIALWLDLGQATGVASVLVGFAGLAAVQRQPERAARLLGAAWYEPNNRQIDSTESPFYDRSLVAVRAQLDEVAFASAWAAGRALTLEQAVAYALEGSDVDAVASIGTFANLDHKKRIAVFFMIA
jgi:tetratricopeptide (TPR) repeat protein